MAIPIAAALAMGMEIFTTVASAIKAGKTEISDAELNAALTELEQSDDDLTAAIERKKARDNG